MKGDKITLYHTSGKTKEVTRFAWELAQEHVKESQTGWSDKKPHGKADEPQGLKAPAETNSYEKIIAQAKGYETDSQKLEALAKYEEAHAIKPTKAVKTKIASLKKALVKQEYDGLFADGEADFAAGEYATALVFFQLAQEFSDTKEVKAKIEETLAQIDETDGKKGEE